MSPLDAYAQVMCRAIWAARRIFPAKDDGLPDIAVAHRDWEWQSEHTCELCGFSGKHKFIQWMDEDVTTAECPRCLFEGTL